jgi:hypothetical protein
MKSHDVLIEKGAHKCFLLNSPFFSVWGTKFRVWTAGTFSPEWQPLSSDQLQFWLFHAINAFTALERFPASGESYFCQR